MKEYTLFRRIGQGCPYVIHIRDNLFSVINDLNLMIEYDEDRGKQYFVDNDFYHNKYKFYPNIIYYCIKVREVTKWEKYFENIDLKEKHIENTKILNFCDYKI